MRDYTSIILSLFVVSILFNSTLVGAGWWNNIFKVAGKEKQITTKVVDDIKNTPAITNYKKGIQWERTAQNSLCRAVGGCLSSAADAAQKLRWSNGKAEVFMIYGGKATNKFINEQGLYDGLWGHNIFTKEPDFLQVRQVNGKITGLIILDAKTSKTAVRLEQETAFLDLCRRSGVECNVDYVIPKNSLSKSDANFLCLATIPLALSGPIGLGIDAVCFLATS